MTPQEAIQLVDNAIAEISAPRARHVQLQSAVQVLNVLVIAEQSRAKRKESIVDPEKK